jgi:iron complex transport system substrate-binding protein
MLKMKSMKKMTAMLLALVMMLSCLTACGSKTSSTELNTTAAAQTTAAETEVSTEESTETTEATEATTEENYDGQLVSDGEMELEYAENFHIELYKGGYRMITAGTLDVQYLVVPEGMSVPADLDDNVKVLQLPIEHAYVSSTGMMSLIAAIGALDHVSLVATDVDGWYIDDIVEKMNSGEITYSGSYKEPDYELMASNEIQLHVDTTMIDSCPEVLDKFAELGIPSLVETSSKESSPLGRVEWVKLFGVLFEKEAEAEEYFNAQKALVEGATAAESTGITVAMGYITSSGKCYSRNGGDYMAQMIGMAGGEYILADMEPEKSGNTNMTFEEWYAANKDADYLFYVNFALGFNSIDEMIAYNPLFADFKAVQNGNVWVTSKDFTQSTAAVASIIADMNTILTSEDGNVTTDHLIKLGAE